MPRLPLGTIGHTSPTTSGTLSRSLTTAAYRGPLDAIRTGAAHQIRRPLACAEMHSETTIVIYFNQNQSIPASGELEKLKPVVERLRWPKATTQVSGHASKEGSDAYNMILSRKRSEFIKQHLLRQGASPEQISVTAHGERQTAVDETGVGRPLEALRRQNRRVEVTFDLYQDLFDSRRRRLQHMLELLRQRLKKAQAAEARTLAHPNRSPTILRLRQQQIDTLGIQLGLVEKQLQDLDAGEKKYCDAKKLWFAKRYTDKVDLNAHLTRERIAKTTQRLKYAQSQAAQTSDPQQRAFWDELIFEYQHQLKEDQKALKDKNF